MSNIENRCLDAFPLWLEQLAADARDLVALLSQADLAVEVRRGVAAGLNYLLKSVDLIPDGIEDVGYVDDAFVVRAAVARVASDTTGLPEPLPRLRAERELIAEFLDVDDARLTKFVEDAEALVVRGRDVDAIVSDAATCADFKAEVIAWANSYRAPSFSREEKSLVRLKSFLTTKLPG